jgi:hypothetical protein
MSGGGSGVQLNLKLVRCYPCLWRKDVKFSELVRLLEETGFRIVREKGSLMKEHIALLNEQGLPVPPINSDPKIVMENEKKLAAA